MNVQQQKNNNNEKIIMCVDVEVFQHQPKWTTIGILISKWPCGSILDTFETGCMRGNNTVSADKIEFWNKHQKAYTYNCKLCKNKKVYEEEERISRFVSLWLKRYPNIYIISDNPSFDVSILQNIYQTNALRQQKSHDKPLPSITVRSGKYFQPICTWSTKRTIQLMSGINFKHITRALYRDVSQMANDKTSNILHTPLYDCSKIVSEYFLILDYLNYMVVY
jgi:hypothetical protein